MISIICAFRNWGDVRLQDYISHYHTLYPQAEILVIIQNDDKLFMKGQLYNIGFLKSVGDVLLFADVDIRLTQYIDLEQIKKPVILHNKVENAEFIDIGNYNRTGQILYENAPGGIYCYDRQNYKDVNGHSNLYIGHTGEDGEMIHRANPFHIDNTVLHLYHEIPEIKYTTSIRNTNIFNSRFTRDIQQDGLRQIIFKIDNVQKKNDYTTFYFISNIGVIDSFIYKNLLL